MLQTALGACCRLLGRFGFLLRPLCLLFGALGRLMRQRGLLFGPLTLRARFEKKSCNHRQDHSGDESGAHIATPQRGTLAA